MVEQLCQSRNIPSHFHHSIHTHPAHYTARPSISSTLHSTHRQCLLMSTELNGVWRLVPALTTRSSSLPTSRSGQLLSSTPSTPPEPEDPPPPSYPTTCFSHELDPRLRVTQGRKHVYANAPPVFQLYIPGWWLV